jgi:hypothetical protein
MKKGWAVSVIMGISCITLLLTGCDPIMKLFGINRFEMSARTIFTSALKAAPVLKNSMAGFSSLLGARSIRAARDGAADPLASREDLQWIYSCIKDFNPDRPTYEQGVDDSNFYVAIDSALFALNKGIRSFNDAKFNSPKTIVSTFAGFQSGTTVPFEGGGKETEGVYERFWAANGSTGGSLEGLAFCNIVDGTGKARNIYYLKYDPAGPVTVDLCDIVTYTDGRIYAPRTSLVGNSVTGDFKIRGTQFGVNSFGRHFYRFEAVGNGKANAYFIAHVQFFSGPSSGTDDLSLGTPTSDYYYRIGATDDDAALALLTPYGSLAELASQDTLNYSATLATVVPFQFGETPHSDSDLSAGNVPAEF